MKILCDNNLRLVIANLNRDCKYRMYLYEYIEGKLYNQDVIDNI